MKGDIYETMKEIIEQENQEILAGKRICLAKPERTPKVHCSLRLQVRVTAAR